MKELQDKIQDKAKVVDQRQVESSVVVASWKKQRGHKVWELDVKAGEMVEVKVEETRVKLKAGGYEVRHKVVRRAGCLYCSALNAKNADKKFMKMLGVYQVLKKGGHIK